MSTTPANPERVLLYLTLGDELLPDEAAPPIDRLLLEQCVALAGDGLAQLRLLHVIDVDPDDPALALPHTEKLLHEESDRARDILNRDLVATLPPELSERCQIEVAAGIPSDEILRAARATDCDLIVLGPADLRGLERLAERILHRGTVGRLLRRSELPICVLDPAAFANTATASGGVHVPRRILVPVDFSPVSRDLVARAEALRAQHGCELYLLHVLRLSLQQAFSRFPDRGYQADDHEKSIIQSAEEKARELLGDRYAHWTVLLYQERVPRAVSSVVAEYEIDFMVLAGISRSRRGLTGTVLGTNAEKILGATHIPAWVVKPADWKAAE